jgi:hypothetical protein
MTILGASMLIPSVVDFLTGLDFFVSFFCPLENVANLLVRYSEIQAQHHAFEKPDSLIERCPLLDRHLCVDPKVSILRR